MKSALRMACEEIAQWRRWYGSGPEGTPREADVDDIVMEFKTRETAQPEDELGVPYLDDE